MKPIVKAACIVAILAETYFFFQVAITPLIPIIKTMINSGVNLQVAFDSASINGMKVTSLAELLRRTCMYFIIYSICVFLTKAVFNFVKRIVP